MPWLHISLPAPPCSVLCPGYAAHIRRSTILCRRISIQSQSMPLHVRSVLSRAMPLPCLSTLCPSLAVLFPGIALLHSDAPCQDRTAQLSAFPFPCFSVQCYAQAFRCYALPLPVAALPSQCYAIPKQLPSVHCRACAIQCFAYAPPRHSMPCLARTFPCSACADLLMTLPKLLFGMLCLCKSALSRYGTRLCNSGAELNATVPLLINSPQFPTFHCQRISFHCRGCTNLYESLLRLASAHHCHALRRLPGRQWTDVADGIP